MDLTEYRNKNERKNENSNSTHLKRAFSKGSWLDSLWTVNRFKTADKRLASRTAQNIFLAELHPRAKRARGRSPIAKEMW